jgi:hypothetical protein
MLLSRAFVGCVALLSAAALAACSSGAANSSTTTGSSSHGAGGGTGTGGAGGVAAVGSTGVGSVAGSGGFTPGPHADPPQVIDYGGSVLTAPKIQIISYASDPFAVEVDKFVTELTHTATWGAQTAEYGVGAFTQLPAIHITGTPPAMLDDDSGDPTPFEATLAANLSGPSPAWGAADPQTIYLFLLPVGTDITSGGHCCTDFLGYHYEVTVGSVSVPYGIVCDCPALPTDTLTPLEYVTTTVIHEMVEAATDPYFTSSAAYGDADDADIIWSIVTGGEVSDMCDYNDDANFTPQGSTYMIQRSWSNAAAKAGKNPCVPVASADPYFNSVAVLSDTVSVDYYGTTVKTKGVTIPVGQTKTIDVQLFSEAPTSGAWTVEAHDLGEYLGTTPHLELSLDKPTGVNGETLHLTIKVLSADTSLGGEGFVLVSNLNGQSNLSLGVVGN